MGPYFSPSTSTSAVRPNWLSFAVIGNGLFLACVLHTQMLVEVSRNTFQVSSGPFTSVLRQPPRLVPSSICRLSGGGPGGLTLFLSGQLDQGHAGISLASTLLHSPSSKQRSRNYCLCFFFSSNFNAFLYIEFFFIRKKLGLILERLFYKGVVRGSE